MATKKAVPEQAKKSNRFRLVVFEGDFSDGSVSEIAQALTSALKPTVPVTMRQLPNGKPAGPILPPEAEEDLQEENADVIEAESVDDSEVQVPAEKAPKASRPKKTKPPVYLHDLKSICRGKGPYEQEPSIFDRHLLAQRGQFDTYSEPG
jgi:hypothetical protein